MEAKKSRGSPLRTTSKSSSKALDDNDGERRHPPHASGGAAAEKRDDDDEEAILDMKVEREWKRLVNHSATESVISKDPRAVSIVEGFTINWMNMRDAASGRLMWESEDWGREMFTSEKTARIPKEILDCKAVSREVNFTSIEMMDDFRLEQRIYFRGGCIEEWLFQFGFVIPGSTNSWQQVIEAADADKMLPADLLSGKLVIETGFYDGPLFLCKTVVRVYYV